MSRNSVHYWLIQDFEHIFGNRIIFEFRKYFLRLKVLSLATHQNLSLCKSVRKTLVLITLLKKRIYFPFC